MAFNRSWNENDPDGDVITISLLDDSQRDIKVAVRERLEGDSSDPYSGIFENGSFANSARIRQGTARAHVATDANIASLPKIDGAIGISSDGKRIYHLASAGIVELEYLNRNGARPATGDIDLGNHNIKNLKPATAAGQAVEYAQAALVDQQKTITNLWTFNRGSSAPFAVPAGSAKVANLDADKLDGHNAGEFLLASSLPAQDAMAKVMLSDAVVNSNSYSDLSALTLVLNQSGTWVVKYNLYISLSDQFNIRLVGPSSYRLNWDRDVSHFGIFPDAPGNASGSGPIHLNGYLSGTVGTSIRIQIEGINNSGTVLAGATCMAIRVS